MRIIARTKIIEYYIKHPDTETALEDWFQKVRKAEWTCFADIKKMFNSADSVGNQHYVFNIRGNSHRLICSPGCSHLKKRILRHLHYIPS